MKTLEWEDNKLKLIDQTKLPDELTYVYCNDYKEVIVAIKDMIVRGAPAIGVAAAFGMALADLHGEDLDNAADEIKAARPTAINLFWAVDRVLNSDDPLEEALTMYKEDIDTNLAIGRYGAEIIEDGDTVLTHCNAGALACVDYGTALGVIRSAFHQGKNINVICDVASGYLMSQYKINKVVIGADRIAKGGVVNKIGSLMVALAAKHFHVPFYVAAPLSTFDMDASVFDTEIEERDGDEVRYYGGCRICPKGTEVINPAFDIVPKELITGIITENGIIDPI